MRGQADEQMELFHTFRVEDRIRANHPLRDIKRRVDRILEAMSSKFDAAYSRTGRPSVPPERLLKALLVMALYSIRSERQLCERIDTDLLFRWFLDMKPSDDAFDATTFSHNRKRLDEHSLTRHFFDAVLAEALTRGLCSEHFSVDGTLIESFASAKSFQPKESPSGEDGPKDGPKDGNGFKPRNAEVDFHGQKRTNATHQSRTDPEAKLYRKGFGRESKLSHMGHVLNENRHGLIMRVTVSEANGTAERSAAITMLDELRDSHGNCPKTLGSDKGFDSGEFYRSLEDRGIEPHGAMIEQRFRSPDEVKPLDRPNTEARLRMKDRQQSEAYKLSQRCRKKVEECFGWLKEVARLGRSRVVGRWKLRQLLELGAAAFNLVRMRKLAPMS
jgi:transposase